MRGMLARLGLLFPTRAEEDAFRTTAILGNLGRTRIAMLLGCFVYYLFSLWDRLVDPLAAHETHLIRAAVVVFALLPLTALTFWSRARPHIEVLLLAYCVIPTAALAFIYSRLAGGYAQGAAGMIIIILFVASLLPMRVLAFGLFAVLAGVSFAVQEVRAAGVASGMAIVNNLYVGTALALALFAVALRERQARQQFRSAAALLQAQRKAEAALADLQAAKTSLIQAEKLAALGQLVAGVAHEVNTPIGLALTTSTTLDYEVRQLAKSVASGRVLRSDLDRAVSRLTEGCRLLFENLYRAGDLIGSFKQVAVDQVSGARRAFFVARSLQELLSSLGPMLRAQGHEVTLDCPADLELDSYPGPLAQVVANLIINAVTHGYPDGGRGRIEVSVRASERGTIQLAVTDDGVGIPAEHREKVLEPFFTTNRRQGSTGLGLHIVHNIVAGTFKGGLSIEGGAGQGTRILVEFPRNSPAPSERRRAPSREPAAGVSL